MSVICVPHFYPASSVTMPGGKRGFKFTVAELESLAETVEEFVPISSTEWERVWNQHIYFSPDKNRTAESLKPCQPHVRCSRKVYPQKRKVMGYPSIPRDLFDSSHRRRCMSNRTAQRLYIDSLFFLFIFGGPGSCGLWAPSDALM